jgi:hypothetical protein
VAWDYAAVKGSHAYHLTYVWGYKLNAALDTLGALDWSVGFPDPPPSVLVERDEEDPWPLEASLSPEEYAYFSFGARVSTYVPGAKLVDNSWWLITPAESGLLVASIDAALACGYEWIERLEPDHPQRMLEMLNEFRTFCAACRDADGFWAY